MSLRRRITRQPPACCCNEIIGSGGDKISEADEKATWGQMLPELLAEIVRRVEEDGAEWPQRQNVMACAAVCRRWRVATAAAAVRRPGTITFPSSLKETVVGCNTPIQCIIRRDKKHATYYLYLALSQSFNDRGKFLLAARRYTRGGLHKQYIVSIDPQDFSQASKAHVGTLRCEDLLGTKYKIYDNQPPHACAKVPGASNFEVGQVAYDFKYTNMMLSCPRKMECSFVCPTSEEISSDEKHPMEMAPGGYITLKNKMPGWLHNLKSWYLNFHGRATVASVKNFQLIKTGDQSKLGNEEEQETVILQLGKVGDNTFTMDYKRPLSPFLAFAICITSFGTKVGC